MDKKMLKASIKDYVQITPEMTKFPDWLDKILNDKNQHHSNIGIHYRRNSITGMVIVIEDIEYRCGDYLVLTEEEKLVGLSFSSFNNLLIPEPLATLIQGFPFPQCENWDMNISLEELFTKSKTCYIDREYKPHRLDNCYPGYCMYVFHPDSDRKSMLMIGINETGFTYIGDGYPNIPREMILEKEGMKPIEIIAGEMMQYKIWLEMRNRNFTYGIPKPSDLKR